MLTTLCQIILKVTVWESREPAKWGFSLPALASTDIANILFEELPTLDAPGAFLAPYRPQPSDRGL